MKWNDHQRAERAARLLHSAAVCATEAARMFAETSAYAPMAGNANTLSALLQLEADGVGEQRASVGVDVEISF